MNAENHAYGNISAAQVLIQSAQFPLLNIFNNQNHPDLNNFQAEYLRRSLHELADIAGRLTNLSLELEKLPIDCMHMHHSINYLLGYYHVIDVTLNIPKNAKLNAYAKARAV